MADMSNDVKGLTEAIDALLKKVNQLHTAVNTLGSDASKQFKAVNGVVADSGGARKIGFGSIRGIMSSSLAGFSNPTATSMGATGMSPELRQSLGMSAVMGGISGAAQVAMAPLAMGYGATMDTSGIVNRAGSYYQAALRSPGLARAGLEKATFSALNGGITGVGSDAQVANILANAGYVPNSKDYLAAVRQVGGAANYLGMNNANAAAAIAGLQSGATGATMYQYGISTIDAKGNSLSVGNIAQQMYGRLIKPGATAAQIQGSAKNGFLNSALAGMGVTSPDQQQMITQAFVDIASGKNPDLASAKAFSGNKNPFSAAYKMNTSQTSIQQSSETSTLNGLNAAAATVTAFNNSMRGLIDSMAVFKGYMDGISSTNAGRGIKSGGSSLLGGLKKVGGAIAMGAGLAGEVLSLGALTVPSAALIAGGAAMTFGGGTPGFGGSFGGKGPRGGGTPGGPNVSAAYGVTDTSGIWASTGNKHMGTDFAVGVGSSVYATLDGTVSNKTLSSDYGQAVVIDHSNGFSTIYAHLSNKEVSPGIQVRKGQEIGKSGASGNTTGPALHYEVWKGANNPVNPDTLVGAGNPVSGGTTSTSAYPSMGGPNTGAVNTNTGTKAAKTWATQFLQAIGAPASSSNLTAMTTWMAHEGGLNHNNPLNTTLDMPGASLWNTQGVKTYTSTQQGVDATIATLTGKSADARGYTQILKDLKTNAEISTTLSDISNSAWVSGKTGQRSYNGFQKGGGTPGYGASVPTTNAYYGIKNTNVATVDGPSKNTVNIYLTVGQASDSEAVAFAKKVQAILDGKNSITTIGNS